MSTESSLFEQEIQGNSDLDAEVAAVGALIEKVASESGVSLDGLSSAEYDRLHASVQGSVESAPIVTTKQAGDLRMAQSPVTAPEPTVADVSRELIKIAAEYNKLEALQSLSAEEYGDTFNKLAAEMLRPDYAERRAQEQEQLKVAAAEAEADFESGRRMARGFHEESLKIAAEMKEKEEKEEKGEKEEDEDGKKEASRAGVVAHNLGQLAKHAPGELAGAASRAASAAAHTSPAQAAKAVGEHFERNRGKYEIAAGAGLMGTGVAGGRASKKDGEKEASEHFDAVRAHAAEMLKQAGIDPAELDAKLEQAKVAAAVEQDAVELLKALGYTVNS